MFSVNLVPRATDRHQSFSAAALMTFWAGQFFLAVAVLCVAACLAAALVFTQ